MQGLRWTPHNEEKQGQAAKMQHFLQLEETHRARVAQLRSQLHCLKHADIPTKPFETIKNRFYQNNQRK